MENKTNANKRSQQLARFLKQQARLKLKQRQELMSRKIELGEMIIQAKLDHYPNKLSKNFLMITPTSQSYTKHKSNNFAFIIEATTTRTKVNG